jgi:hypothetical protein
VQGRLSVIGAITNPSDSGGNRMGALQLPNPLSTLESVPYQQENTQTDPEHAAR